MHPLGFLKFVPSRWVEFQATTILCQHNPWIVGNGQQSWKIPSCSKGSVEVSPFSVVASPFRSSGVWKTILAVFIETLQCKQSEK